MKYRYRAVERFWTIFYRLSPAQKEAARKVWLIFKEDPFDARLRTHKIHRLSATGAPFPPLKLKATCARCFIWMAKPLSHSLSARMTFTKVDSIVATET